MFNQKTPQYQMPKPKRIPWIPIGIGAIVVVAGLSFGGYKWYQSRHKPVASQTPNPQTELGNESQRDDSATNTNQQNQALASDKTSSSTSTPTTKINVTIPTPTLLKSSGNNGSVPKGAVIEFTCIGPAGYNCKVVLSGAHSQTFANKNLIDNGRTTPSVSWTWTAETGKHNVIAVLSDNKGNEQSSSTQTLEVQS